MVKISFYRILVKSLLGDILFKSIFINDLKKIKIFEDLNEKIIFFLNYEKLEKVEIQRLVSRFLIYQKVRSIIKEDTMQKNIHHFNFNRSLFLKYFTLCEIFLVHFFSFHEEYYRKSCVTRNFQKKFINNFLNFFFLENSNQYKNSSDRINQKCLWYNFKKRISGLDKKCLYEFSKKYFLIFDSKKHKLTVFYRTDFYKFFKNKFLLLKLGHYGTFGFKFNDLNLHWEKFTVKFSKIELKNVVFINFKLPLILFPMTENFYKINNFFFKKRFSRNSTPDFFFLEKIVYFKTRIFNLTKPGILFSIQIYKKLIYEIFCNLLFLFNSKNSQKLFKKKGFLNINGPYFVKIENKKGRKHSIQKRTNFLFSIFKNFFYKNELLFFVYELELNIKKYGDCFLICFLKKLNFKFVFSKNKLNNSFLLNLLIQKNNKISQKNRSKIRKISNLSPQNSHLFLVNFLVHKSEKDLSKKNNCFVDFFGFKKSSIHFKIMIKKFLIIGFIGKIFLKLLDILMSFGNWKFFDKKIFWNYWLYIEIYQTNKIIKMMLGEIRINYSILNKYELFYEDFI